MRFADNIWLGATATQRSWNQMISYNAAFCSAAAIQGWKLGIDAPMAFWQAIGRAGEMPRATVAAKAKAKAAPVAPVAAPVPAPEPVAAANPKAKPETRKVKAAPKAVAAPSKAAAPDPAPKAKPAEASRFLDAPRGGKPDDLTVMSGTGEKLALVMHDFGLFHFDQIASLTDKEIDRLNTRQPGFKAVMKRFDLVGQAKALAK